MGADGHFEADRRGWTASRSLQIEYRELGEIRPCRRNPREHSRRQLDKLKKSLRRWDFVQPIIVDEQAEIIAGHAVYLAAKELGADKVPIIPLYGLSDVEKRRLRIALNKLGDLSKFSSDALKSEVIAILDDDPLVDPEELGFEVAEWDQIIHVDPDIDDDRVPEAARTPRAQLGDVWNLGDHVVGCGDARDSDFVRKVAGDIPASVAFLDVPYNVSITSHATRSSQHSEFAMASGEMSDGEFIDFLGKALAPARDCTRDGGVHFLCIDHHHVDQLMAAARPLYGARLHICVWNKSNAGMGSLYRSKHEFVAVYRVGDAQHRNNVQLGRYGRSRTSVWDYPSVNMVGTSRAADLKLHPTVKPVALVADAIKDVTKPGDIVLDTFLGSGTTLIAAERTGRQCRGVEIDPHYVDIIIERWMAITGGEPVLIHRAGNWPAPSHGASSNWGTQNG